MSSLIENCFWLSWYQPTEDHRPLKFPPNEKVVGWWCTGRTSYGVATLVAMVSADTEDEAKDVVKIDWPEAREWRFCDRMLKIGPPDGRFPLKTWMLDRLNKLIEQEGGEG